VDGDYDPTDAELHREGLWSVRGVRCIRPQALAPVQRDYETVLVNARRERP
jgi:hypothetical protein